ncbi:MAG: molybdopterin molybdenumtransferase, partial [Mycobacterium sp.]
MRSVEEQQARVTAAAVAPRPVRVAIAEAQGLLCAEEVVTEHPLPGFDQAAIDGYAVRSVDVQGVGQGDPSEDQSDDQADDGLRSLSAAEGSSSGGGVTLPVMGTVQAGARTPSRLQPGQAARVQTGA